MLFFYRRGMGWPKKHFLGFPDVETWLAKAQSQVLPEFFSDSSMHRLRKHIFNYSI